MPLTKLPKIVSVESRSIGPNQRPLLIAEVSANHDKDLDHALALVDVAADAGWDCLKLQTYNADTLTMRSNHPSMKIDPIWGTDNLYNLYENACMPMEFHAPLFSKARDRGLMPFTSIYDPRDLDFIENLGCPIYKIASFEMTFDDLLKCVAQTGKPIILSTGMATLAEIAHALEILDKNGAGPTILLHCCSSYPASLESINLNAMLDMGTHFNNLVGFSDHTIGTIAPLTAISMGAVAIEKHYTSDPTRDGPDHRFSATPDIMKKIANGVDDIMKLRGSSKKGSGKEELVNKAIGRRSAFASKDLPKGTIITRDDLRFIRPNAGIPANDVSGVLGKTLCRPILKGHPITYSDISGI
ncbi:N-acetylneuraminate synthase family protein [Planktomarina sp.]|nr:N-acetylneuraminate synthase family protein [Planktomarina sp.]